MKIEIYFDEIDRDYADNICVQIIEECPDNEKVFIHDETNLFLTPDEAQALVDALQEAIEISRAYRPST